MYAHKKLYIISAENLIYEENENMKEIHVLYQKLPLSIIQINRSLKEIADALCKPIEIFRSINTAFLKGQDKYISGSYTCHYHCFSNLSTKWY